MNDRRAILASLTLAAIGGAVLFGALVALAYLAMVGVGECADPWAGCRTVMGVVG